MTTKPSMTDRMNSAQLLGVSLGAGRDEIKQAWKRAAFEMHPDRGGNADEFAELSEAYQVLLATAPKSAAPQKTSVSARQPSRPAVKKRTESIRSDSKARCMEILRALAVQGQVATETRRTGRYVSYFFEEPMQPGKNHVSVDTGEFVRRAKPMPVHVELDSNDTGESTVELTDEKLAEMFPGARRVRLHFAKDAQSV